MNIGVVKDKSDSENIEFLIEGSYESPTITFIRNGKPHPVKHSLAELPVPYSIEGTVDEFKERWPDDKVTVTDKRISN